MFDVGWSELLIIGVVALIVIGPKDLPEMFRQLGRFTAKLRSMARDFQRTMEAAADDAGVKDVAKDLKAMANPKSLGIDAVKEAATKFEKWDPLKPAAAKPAPVTALGPKPAAAPAAAAAPAQAAAPGPATQALLDQKAERHRIAMEAAEKMRSVGKPAPAAEAAPAAPAPKPAPRKRAATAAAPAEAADAAPKARARKPKDAP